MSSNLKKKKPAAQATMEEEKLVAQETMEEEHENNKNHQEEEELEIEIGDGDGYCIDDFPPGYRFRPTDEELVKYYLTRKIDNKPLPHDKIKEVFLYQNTPRQLTDENLELGENEWYFFTPRERKYKQGSRPNRKAGDGYWKATGANIKITSKGKLIGHKKSLVYYEGKPPRGIKSEWIMHEYVVANRPTRHKLHENDMRLDDWVLCRLKKKPESANKPMFLEHDGFDANPLAIALEELEEEEEEEEEEENYAQFSQNNYNQASTMSSMGEHGGSAMSSMGGHGGLAMSSMGGHGGSTMSTGLAYDTTVSHENFRYNVTPMDYDYGVQQNVYIPPPLEYPMGNNNNNPNIPPYVTYDQATNYRSENFDVRHDHMLSTNFVCKIEPAHSGVMDDHMLSTDFAFEILPAHSSVVDAGASFVDQLWANEENLSEMARLDFNPELTRSDYNPDGSLR